MPNLMFSQEYHHMYQVEDQHWWYKALRQVLQSVLLRMVPKESLVVDAGCGTGSNSMLFATLGYKVTSFDLSSQAIKYCKQRGLTQAQVGSVTKMPVKTGSAAAVAMMDVIVMLTPDQVEVAISETYRVLKPGGVAIIQVAAFEWLHSSHDVVSQVRHRYTRPELEALFDTSKWQIKMSTYRIWTLFPLLAGFKWLKRAFQSHNANPTGDLWLPPRLLNQLLYWVQWLEDTWLPIISFPWGTSLFIVVQKK